MRKTKQKKLEVQVVVKELTPKQLEDVSGGGTVKKTVRGCPQI